MINKKHQVVIGYTHELCSEGLEAMIDSSDDFAIHGIFPVSKLAEHLKTKNSADIIIIELRCPGNRDLNFMIQLKKEHPLIRIMLISLQPCLALSKKLIDSGIEAFILKSCSKADMFAALRKIAEGKSYYCSDIIKSFLTPNSTTGKKTEIELTQREVEVLGQLAAGKSNSKIAKELKLSENTVKTHRKNILAKFGVNNLIGMIRFACRARLLDYGSDGFCEGCPHFN
jgi:DNA-binding NarL/FixJ family response regulator